MSPTPIFRVPHTPTHPTWFTTLTENMPHSAPENRTHSTTICARNPENRNNSTTESYQLEIFTDLRGRVNAATSSWGGIEAVKFWIALPSGHVVW